MACTLFHTEITSAFHTNSEILRLPLKTKAVIIETDFLLNLMKFPNFTHYKFYLGET